MKESIRKVKIFWIFYKKLYVPSLLLSILLGLMGLIDSNSYSLPSVGVSYILITPIFQYLTYELRNKNEYYFYFNQGLSRRLLWTLTCVVSFVIGLLFIII